MTREWIQSADTEVMFINLLRWNVPNWDQLLLFRYFSDNSIIWARRLWFKVSPVSQKSKRGKTDRLRRMEERESAWEKRGDYWNSWADGLAVRRQGHTTFEIIVWFWLLYKILCLTDFFPHTESQTLRINKESVTFIPHCSNWYIVSDVFKSISSALKQAFGLDIAYI